jgi:hypothetical protein
MSFTEKKRKEQDIHGTLSIGAYWNLIVADVRE